jgi:Asp-tRNA(Asn)/Glu-tRNA(Gln) amidotransferase A subunit family amidase
MGMQIIAPRGNDLKLIAFAKKFENMVNNTNNNGVRL